MKKILIKAVASILIFAIIIAGYFSGPMLSELFYAVIDFPNYRSVADFQERVESASKDISFKELLVDLQSVVYYLTATRYVEKEDETIFLSAENYLIGKEEVDDSEAIAEHAKACSELNKFAKERNIHLLYCFAPGKAYFDKNQPAYIQSCDEFLNNLKSCGVNVLDLADEMQRQSLPFEQAYYITDHHWRTETAFWAFGEICKKLYTDYGFEYDTGITDLSNYKIKTYEDWFLGSYGKKVGRFFTPLGTDDISIITPAFETNLSVKDSDRDTQGGFDQAVLNMNSIETKDYYNKNPYTVYGGNYAEKLIVNNLASADDKNILIIRDSFAHSILPFMALVSGSVKGIDLRTSLLEKERIESVYNYIDENDFDYIIIIYSDGGSSGEHIEKYRFE